MEFTLSGAMAASCILPSFSNQKASALLEQLYGLSGELQRLNGERDLNFLLTTNAGKFVFKIANENESLGMLDCQQAVFQRLATDKVFPDQIQAVETKNGNCIETVKGENGKLHLCRLLNYVDGQLLSEVNPQFPELLADLGKKLGQLDKALERLKVLDDDCFFGCEEFDELEQAIEAYRRENPS